MAENQNQIINPEIPRRGRPPLNHEPEPITKPERPTAPSATANEDPLAVALTDDIRKLMASDFNFAADSFDPLISRLPKTIGGEPVSYPKLLSTQALNHGQAKFLRPVTRETFGKFLAAENFAGCGNSNALAMGQSEGCLYCGAEPRTGTPIQVFWIFSKHLLQAEAFELEQKTDQMRQILNGSPNMLEPGVVRTGAMLEQKPAGLAPYNLEL